uniref:Uncharacterized protein n=1 Tax=Anopheles coluzzii TaxID=1518534 RepID=A0A8W7PRV4_ANOCL
MKMHRCLLCVVIALMSVLHCSGQSSEERALGSDPNYPELDRSKMQMASLNGLLDTLEHDSTRQLGGGPDDYELVDSLAARLGYPHANGDIKRSWSKMNAAWGKRLSGGNRNSGWTKFGVGLDPELLPQELLHRFRLDRVELDRGEAHVPADQVELLLAPVRLLQQRKLPHPPARPPEVPADRVRQQE